MTTAGWKLGRKNMQAPLDEIDRALLDTIRRVGERRWQMNPGKTLLPEGWFLFSLRHMHTPIIYKGDKHMPLHWQVRLQHVDGGRLTEGIGATARKAIDDALEKLKLKLSNV